MTALAGLGEPRRAAGNRLEDWLDVRLRLADHPEDLGGAVWRSRASVRSRLRASSFLEEPHVSMAIHRLVGEGLHRRSAPP